MDELKPCPFCGGEARFVNHLFVTDKQMHFMVCCNNKDCEIMPVSAFKFLSKEEAAEAWNRRANNG